MAVSPEDLNNVAEVATDTGPFAAKNLIPSLWMAGIAAAGGAVNFYHKIQTGQVRAFNLTEFVGEIVTSGFVGVLTFWICKAFAVNEWATAAGVAIAGHMGARAIFLIEKYIEQKAGK